MERMQRKEQGHKGARPASASSSIEKQENENCCKCVNEGVDEMIPAALHPEKLVVEKVRKPGYRKPVRRLAGGDRPGNCLRSHSAADMRVTGDVIGIVVINEIKVPGR